RTTACPAAAVDDGCAATLRARRDRRARELPARRSPTAYRRRIDTSPRTTRTRRDAGRCRRAAALRHRTTASARRRCNAALRSPPQWFQRHPQFFHGSEHAVFRGARAEPEHAADLIDGPAFVVAKRERG